MVFIEQKYIPYYDWEDYKSGMWRKLKKEEENGMLVKAIVFTGDHCRYGKGMKEVISLWPKTMINSLTNKNINRRAFLGHCACQFKIDCPEYITRMAWKHLNNDQRQKADFVAQSIINEWLVKHEKENRGIHQNMGIKMLF